MSHLVGFFELVAHFVEGERPPNAFQAAMAHPVGEWGEAKMGEPSLLLSTCTWPHHIADSWD